MHRNSQVTFSLAFASLFAIIGGTAHAQDASLAQLPLLAQNNLTYLGSFTLPPGDGTGSKEGSLAYAGQALSVTPEGTLLLAGHTWYSSMCELTIPGIGGTATVRQPCVDVTEGLLSQVDAGSQTEFGGSLQYGGRLLVSAYSYYDADGNQARSHFVSGTTLATPGDVVGPVKVGTTGAGFVSGYMGLIPPEWQTALGGTALTGNCCLSIISRTSTGPAISVFNPDDVGRVDPVPATQVLGYPLANSAGGVASTLFNFTTMMGGVAFPTGTRSVLFIGRLGTGPQCYGTSAECGDPVNDYKGYHAYPYVHRVWAYDANDLVAVKNGQKQPHAVTPYATWQLSEMNSTGSASITSAFYDQTTGRIYITEAYGGQPQVHVYQVSGGGAVTAPTTVTPPAATTPPTTTAPTPTTATTTEPTMTEATTIAPPTTTTRTRTWRRRGRWSR